MITKLLNMTHPIPILRELRQRAWEQIQEGDEDGANATMEQYGEIVGRLPPPAAKAVLIWETTYAAIQVGRVALGNRRRSSTAEALERMGQDLLPAGERETLTIQIGPMVNEAQMRAVLRSSDGKRRVG